MQQTTAQLIRARRLALGMTQRAWPIASMSSPRPYPNGNVPPECPMHPSCPIWPGSWA